MPSLFTKVSDVVVEENGIIGFEFFEIDYEVVAE